MNRPTTILISRRAALSTLGIALGAFTTGRLTTGMSGTHFHIVRADDATPDATQTAERAELDALRTQIANPTVCVLPTETPEPSPTATATLEPPAATGTPVQYNDSWTVTVLGIAPAIPAASMVPTGQLLQVNYAVQNLTSEAHLPPFTQFTLTDAEGTSSGVDVLLNQTMFGSSGSEPVNGNASENRSVVFDFPTRTSTQFTFGSSDQPSFRISVAIQSRN
jgi:hypothetical protein